MLHKTVKHIHHWRLFFLAAITMLFLVYAQINPLDIGYFMSIKMGRAVGMTTSVPENPFNKLALQLEEKSDRLDLRESELENREASLENSVIDSQKKLLIFVAIGIVVLFILILFNFYYDWYRQKRRLKN